MTDFALAELNADMARWRQRMIDGTEPYLAPPGTEEMRRQHRAEWNAVAERLRAEHQVMLEMAVSA